MEDLLKSQQQLEITILQKMEELQTQLQTSPASGGSETLAEEFSSFREFILQAIKSLQDQFILFLQETDNLEMKSRRKILLFHGVPEEEDIKGSIVNIVTQKLKITEFSAAHMCRCYRMGRQPRAERPGPRPIVVKIHDMSVRQKVWYAKTSLKGTGVTISEFLTKSRHDTFMVARERFGMHKCFTQEGFVYVMGDDGERYRVYNVADLDKLNGVVSLTTNEPEEAEEAEVAEVVEVVEAAAAPKATRRVRFAE